MGASTCSEVTRNKRSEIEVKQDDSIENFPFSLFLLSLIKIKEIKSLLLKHQQIIEKNPSLKLLPILNDLNKSTKLINDYANKFKKLFSQTKTLDQRSVSLDINALKIAKKVSSLTNHLQKSFSGMMILRISLQMLSKLCNTCSKNCNLNLR